MFVWTCLTIIDEQTISDPGRGHKKVMHTTWKMSLIQFTYFSIILM